MASTLRAPPGSLYGFPPYVIPEVVPLLRVHKRSWGPWWFAQGTGMPDEGRFDLPASSPFGTCYLAEEAYGAFLEHFQEWIDSSTPISWKEVRKRRISTLHLRKAVTLADCTAGAARAFGVTAEIHTHKDRALTQQWAAAFRRDNFDGVRYFASNDNSMKQVCVALFTDKDPRVASSYPNGFALPNWPVAKKQKLTATFVGEVESRFGIKVR